MSGSVIQGISRATRSIARDFTDAVRREQAYANGDPKLAILFLTYRCTSRCRTCQMWQMQWRMKEELSPHEWLTVADILCDAGVRTTELFGGDVLLRKDVLFPLIRRLKSRGVTVHIPTNCKLLDSETARMLVASGVDVLYLSTDGVDSVHDEIRGVNDAFGKVQRAVAELRKCRQGAEKPRFVCNTTVSRFNVAVLERIARFALEAGFDETSFEYVGEFTPEDISSSEVDGMKPTLYFLRGEESVLVSSEQARAMKKKLKAVRREHLLSPIDVTTVNIDCLSRRHMVEGTVPRNRCYTERCEVTVDPAGNVVACPFFHSIKYGNLLRDRFESVWRSERHQRFHARAQEGLPMCRHCIPSVERSQPFSERLRRISTARFRVARQKLAELGTGNNSKNE